MAHSAASTFNAQAGQYDALRRRLIPPFEDFNGTAVQALSLAARKPTRILDLGAGTGLLSALIRRAHPDAELVLLDAASAMLERAQEAVCGPAAFIVADLRDPLPAGTFDAIVSALAIHHLDNEAKPDPFARVHDALAPGGIFVNAEQVAGPSDTLDRHYRQWHQRSSARLGTSPLEWAAAEERMSFDQCSSVEDQLHWLRATGFEDVDCLFKHHRFAVLIAARRRGHAEGATP